MGRLVHKGMPACRPIITGPNNRLGDARVVKSGGSTLAWITGRNTRRRLNKATARRSTNGLRNGRIVHQGAALPSLADVLVDGRIAGKA